MAQTLLASIADDSSPVLRISLSDDDTITVAPTQLVTGTPGFPSLQRSLTTGVGANQANKFYYRGNRTVGAGGFDDYVLSNGSLKDRYGNGIVFTSVVYLLLRLRAPAAGQLLRMGNAPQPWPGWWGGGAALVTTRTWTQFLDDVDAVPVAAGDTLRVTNPGAGPVSYDLVLLGRG